MFVIIGRAARILLLGFAFIYSHVAVATVVWDESLDGDLNSDNIGFLTAGDYTVSGSTSMMNTLGQFTRDNDHMLFNLSDGFYVSGISVIWSNVIFGGDELDTYTFSAGLDDTSIYMWLHRFGNPSPSTSLIDRGATASTYDVGVYLGGIFAANRTSSVNFDYSIDFVIDQVATGEVPEPSVIALLSLGLLGYAATRRRKQQA